MLLRQGQRETASSKAVLVPRRECSLIRRKYEINFTAPSAYPKRWLWGNTSMRWLSWWHPAAPRQDAVPCPRTVPCALKARGAALDRERAAWYRSMGGMGRRERPGRSAGLLLGGALDPPLALSIQGKPPGIAVRHRPRSGYPAGTGTRMGWAGTAHRQPLAVPAIIGPCRARQEHGARRLTGIEPHGIAGWVGSAERAERAGAELERAGPIRWLCTGGRVRPGCRSAGLLLGGACLRRPCDF